MPRYIVLSTGSISLALAGITKQVISAWRPNITALIPTRQRTSDVGCYAFAAFPPASHTWIQGNIGTCMGLIEFASPDRIISTLIFSRMG